MKEIEVKILNVDREEFMGKLDREIVNVHEFEISESYWLSPLSPNKVRMRSISFLDGKNYGIDLTVKQEINTEEELDISIREEVNLEILYESDGIELLSSLGFKKVIELKKSRYKFQYKGNSIQFDTMGDINWVEIESPDIDTLYAFLFQMGYSKADLNKKSTEELYMESELEHLYDRK